MAKRIPYFDFLRGIAIIMVVAIHTITSSNSDLSICLRQFFNCAVPLFLAISGFFMSHKDVSTSDRYWQFVKKQVPKVYLHCLFWSVPLVLVDIHSNNFGLKELILFFVCGYSIYYFIALIIQFYILLPILKKFRGRKAIALSGLMSTVCISIVTYLLHVRGLNIPLVAFAGPFVLWIVFFMMGLYIGRTDNRKIPVLMILVLTIVFLYLSVLEYKYWNAIDGSGIGIKLSSFVFSAFVVLLFFSEKLEVLFSRFGKIYQLVILIGNLSFGIYLMHCYVVNVIIKLLPPSLDTIWALKWFLVLTISTVIVWLGRKYLPNKINLITGF